MPQESTEPIIPTLYKGRLPKGASYPFGAQIISTALQAVPQFENLTMSFHNQYPATKVFESTPVDFLQITYIQIPPSLSSHKDSRRSIVGPKWEIVIRPILSAYRKVASDYMAQAGFEFANHWLCKAWNFDGRDGKATLCFVLDPGTSTISTNISNQIMPAR